MKSERRRSAADGGGERIVSVGLACLFKDNTRVWITSAQLVFFLKNPC
ncbi:MAG: hypothetical protein ACWA5W_03135 [Phycisphaerales bacterium]